MPDRPEQPQKKPCPEGICKPGGTAHSCPHCQDEEDKLYWCEVCHEAFASKRCPQCGLKLKRVPAR